MIIGLPFTRVGRAATGVRRASVPSNAWGSVTTSLMARFLKVSGTL